MPVDRQRPSGTQADTEGGVVESLKQALTKLPVQSAIIDGEIVCLDAQGVSRFDKLLGRKASRSCYAVDLLWLDGEDLRQTTLLNRKSLLAAFIQSAGCKRILYAQDVEQHGKRFFE